MDKITDKTNITDLSKIKIPKCYEKNVYKAIGSSVNLLTIKEFIEITGFNIHSETFDKLFMNINDENIPIYIDDEMLNWMGYEGENKLRKKNCKKLIQNNFDEEIDYKILKNKDYIEFLEKENKKIKGAQMHTFKSILPKPAEGSSSRSIRHLIIMPDAFRSLCMMINTNKGKKIRKYYITLEKLIKAYNLYQTIFRGQQAERAMQCKDDKLDKVLSELKDQKKENDIFRKELYERQADYDEKQRDYDRQIKQLLGISFETKEELKETNTLLKGVAKQHVEINKLNLDKHPKFIILKDPNDKKFPYYAIRRQKESIQEGIDEIKKDYPSLEEWLNIPQPNAVAFFNLVKKKLKSYIKRSGHNWFGLNNITEEEFKNKVIELNNNRINPQNIK